VREEGKIEKRKTSQGAKAEPRGHYMNINTVERGRSQKQ